MNRFKKWLLTGLAVIVLGAGLQAVAQEKLTKEEKKAAKAAAKAEKKAKKQAKLEGKLVDILGGPESWKPAALKNVRLGMTCREVAEAFPGIDCSEIFPTATTGFDSPVYQYEFHFVSKKLSSVTIIFGSRLLDEKVFTETLAGVANRKWGENQSPELNEVKWSNPDFDDVSFEYKETHWLLKVDLPTFDPGDADPAGFTADMLQREIENLLGSGQTYLPAIINQLSGGMTAKKVAELIPGFKGTVGNQSYSYQNVSLEGHPLVAGLQFSFKNDRLRYVNLVFHYQIDRELFKTVVFPVLQKRWGKAARISRDGESLSVVLKPGYFEWRFNGNRWEAQVGMEGIKADSK